VDEELDALISRIKLKEGNKKFWKHHFSGERELKNKPHHRWSQEREVELAIKVTQKVNS